MKPADQKTLPYAEEEKVDLFKGIVPKDQNQSPGYLETQADVVELAEKIQEMQRSASPLRKIGRAFVKGLASASPYGLPPEI